MTGTEKRREGRQMKTVETIRRVGSPGCEELGEAGLVDTAGCCELCHSAERHTGMALGPCRVVLPDEGEPSSAARLKNS